MPLIEWDEERHSTGIQTVDDQHMRLFELLNDLHAAMEEGRADEEVGTVLQDLDEYTEYHFTDEEGMMQDCGYADECNGCFNDHKEVHAEFASRVSQLRERHEDGEYITMDVLQFARDWLDSHIAGDEQDQSYGEYVQREFTDYTYE
ncbi:bacteriohemerythrin [Salinibaculum rarum]|jgi:hemerythrin-like metal-binding protein|uniref:bacteriohemerythrin n=1 Tax=Salinibaculum rarum TaxID=3058903 RepID=UPI0026603B0A|nr:bacteriohemerythrin [Salinibaculum sp. KK48]